MTRLFLLLTLVLTPVAQAQNCDTSWASPVDGHWTVPGNWTNGVPVGNDVVCITVPGTYTVTAGTASTHTLILGGASGTQTLQVATRITIGQGGGEIRANGRLHLTPDGGGTVDGLVSNTTVLVQGVLVKNGPQAGLLRETTGTIDVAPGGRLEVIGGGGIGNADAFFRIRGTLEASACTGSSGVCTMSAPFEVDGGTVHLTSGSLYFPRNGYLRNATLDADAGAEMRLAANLEPFGERQFIVEGTLSGEPEGRIWLLANARLAAGSGGGTLNFGGAGLESGGGSFTSAGGSFLNTGLVWASSASSMESLTFYNEGHLRFVGVSFTIGTDGVLQNQSEGVIELTGPSVPRIQGVGEIRNAGLLVLNGSNAQGQSGINVTFHGQPGSTTQSNQGILRFNGGGSFRDVHFVAAETGSVWIYSNAGAQYVAEGTLSGEPEGTVRIFGQALVQTWFAAGPAGATLNFGGTGLQLALNAMLTSAGGSFLNTGFIHGSAWAINAGLMYNEGHIQATPAFRLLEGGVLRNTPQGIVELAGSSSSAVTGNGRLENAGLLLRTGPGVATIQHILYSQPGSEIRAIENTIQIPQPPHQTHPAGVITTGTGHVRWQGVFEHQGIISPGTDGQPLATLTVDSFRPSLVAGSPQLIIDVDQGGQSDALNVLHQSGPSNARLGGTLIVRVRPGYVPQIGDEFTIITAQRNIEGQFGQIAVDGAPEDIAFTTELAGNQQSLILRAVETAPDGPVSVSSVTPVGGAVRSIFLTGAGAIGITDARLECTTCLNAEQFGMIEADLEGEGSIKEARFDLSHPQAFGYYDLVIVRPGRENVVVPITVRPFLGFVFADGGLARGARVVPQGFGYNYSGYRMRTRTNDDASAFAIPHVRRSNPSQYALALSATNPFGGGVVFFESDNATDPERAPQVFGRIQPNQVTHLTFGLRVSPEHIIFPEQSPDGPDDPRIPFGEPQSFAIFGAQHLSFHRAAGIFSDALRNSAHGGLAGYIASVDAANPDALWNALVQVFLFRQPAYFTTPAVTLGLIIEELNSVVSAPAGLAQNAADTFDLDIEMTTDARYNEIELAHYRALTNGPAEVTTLFYNELDALFPEGFPWEDQSRADLNMYQRFMCWTFGPSIGAINNIGGEPPTDDPKGKGGGAWSCPSPEASADPNDKLAENNLMCEFGLVEVDGEEVWRCVRYFVPLEQAAERVFYTITFENLPQATANADFITITDEIDENLNLNTLEIVGTSHDDLFSYDVDGRTVTFRFIDIDLPPNVESPEGEGYVKFSIRPNTGLEEGTEFRNSASIVFDFNPAIETPEVIHEVRSLVDVATLVSARSWNTVGTPLTFTIAAGNIRGDTAGDVTLTISLPDVPVLSVTTTAGECDGNGILVCEFGELTAGEFATVTIVTQPESTGEITLTAVAETSSLDGFEPNNTDAAVVQITSVGNEDDSSGIPRELTLNSPYPNPTRNFVTLDWGLPAAERVDIRVYDLLGREVVRLIEGDTYTAGWHQITWDARVASGAYIVRLTAGNRAVTQRVIVIR